MPRAPRWNDDPSRAELLAIYAETDALMAPFDCAHTSECCDFGLTGREPLPTTVELAEVIHRARSTPAPKTRRLPLANGSRACPMLGDDLRCRIYESRPFGCRTFFCERVEGPGKLPRPQIQALARRIANLSQRAFSRDPLPRPLTRGLADAAGLGPLEALARCR